MADSTLRRVEKLEEQMTTLSGLPERVDALEAGLADFRAETLGEFAAVRGEIRNLGENLRGEMRALGEELRDEMRTLGDELRGEMRILHEDVIARIALLQEGLARPRRKRPPR